MRKWGKAKIISLLFQTRKESVISSFHSAKAKFPRKTNFPPRETISIFHDAVRIIGCLFLLFVFRVGKMGKICRRTDIDG